MKRKSENEPNTLPSLHVAPRIVLFLLTICCICSMGFYYFKKENIVSVGQAAALVAVPFQKGINAVGGFFFDLDRERIEKEEALAKIESLETENQALKDELEKNSMMVYEYQQAKKLLELKDTYSEYETIGAEILFADASSNWFSSFTIDKGSEDGIEKDMNVLADGGLVGYISNVSSHYATVTTIINDNVNVSGMQLSTRDSCMVIGDFPLMKEKGLLRLEYMSVDFDMSRDTTIVTSQISDRYLPGIVIGYIQEASVNDNRIASSGYLKPAVDFEHLSRVLVATTKKEVSKQE